MMHRLSTHHNLARLAVAVTLAAGAVWSVLGLGDLSVATSDTVAYAVAADAASAR